MANENNSSGMAGSASRTVFTIIERHVLDIARSNLADQHGKTGGSRWALLSIRAFRHPHLQTMSYFVAAK